MNKRLAAARSGEGGIDLVAPSHHEGVERRVGQAALLGELDAALGGLEVAELRDAGSSSPAM